MLFSLRKKKGKNDFHLRGCLYRNPLQDQTIVDPEVNRLPMRLLVALIIEGIGRH